MLHLCHQAVLPSGDWSAVGNHLQIHLDPASSSIFLQHDKIWQFIGNYFSILCATYLWIPSKHQRPEALFDLYFESMWYETWLMHQEYWYILHVSLECHKNIHGSQESSVGLLCNATVWTILSIELCLFSKISWPALGATHPPIN
jgi:hypothetical protein